MFSISLCMIVKNEAHHLARCLSSVEGIADEIIIVDTGSVDGTKEIASRFTTKIYDFKWIDDFSAARNFAFSKAQCDYQMWLDADDVIEESQREKLLALKESYDGSADIIALWYATIFDEQGTPTFKYYRERLLKREKNYLWQEPVHECIPLIGHVLYQEIYISHKKEVVEGKVEKGRNLRIYESIIARGKSLSTRGQFYYARELKDHGKYEDAVRQFRSFLDSRMGWIEDNINACLEASKCLLMLKREQEALEYLYRSFSYDLPRAETCCSIAYIYKNRGDYHRAIFWFSQAANAKATQSGFINADMHGYVPYLELTVCYDKLGEREKAIFYNEKAAEIKPDSSAVKYNREYFAKSLK